VKRRSGPAPTDRFEEEPATFFERVRAEYLRLARVEPARFRIIDAGAALEAVQQQVAGALESLVAGA
jgi:dTMP kinase